MSEGQNTSRMTRRRSTSDSDPCVEADKALISTILGIAERNCDAQTQSPLFSLPPELRIQIYHHCVWEHLHSTYCLPFNDLKSIRRSSRKVANRIRQQPRSAVPAPLQACKRLAGEACELLYRASYGRAHFLFAETPRLQNRNSNGTIRLAISTVGSLKLGTLRHVEVTFDSAQCDGSVYLLRAMLRASRNWVESLRIYDTEAVRNPQFPRVGIDRIVTKLPNLKSYEVPADLLPAGNRVQLTQTSENH